jgi:hypothetical protein
VTRLSFYALCAVVCLSAVASADIKIKTRTTVQGHTTEGTAYIKGARERTEMSLGGRSGSVNIIQCDQKRAISVFGDNCMVTSMGGTETTCPAKPNMGDMARGMSGREPATPRKGGVVTISRNSTDTGERQDMFGYKARHIKTTMMMESTPDACNQSHMKMEMDGWYADLSAGFSCGDESYRSMACGGPGAKSGCSDRIVMKGSGGTPMGYPMKQTTTVTSDQGTFTMSTEVVELSSTTLEPALFEMPPGCRVMDMSAMAGGAPAAHSEAAPAPAPAPTAAPAPAPTASVAPKAAGVVRVGVVKIKDMSGQGLPIDNLRLNLISELERNKFEVVPLTAETPHSDVEAEARAKQCDYIVYTTPTTVKEPNSGGLPPGSLPKGLMLDPAKYQAVTAVTLYKVDKPQPELKDVPAAADAGQFGVDAVMATFVVESDFVAHQIADDANPKAAKTAKPAAKTPAKTGAATTKPK